MSKKSKDKGKDKGKDKAADPKATAPVAAVATGGSKFNSEGGYVLGEKKKFEIKQKKRFEPAELRLGDSAVLKTEKTKSSAMTQKVTITDSDGSPVAEVKAKFGFGGGTSFTIGFLKANPKKEVKVKVKPGMIGKGSVTVGTTKYVHKARREAGPAKWEFGEKDKGDTVEYESEDTFTHDDAKLEVAAGFDIVIAFAMAICSSPGREDSQPAPEEGGDGGGE